MTTLPRLTAALVAVALMVTFAPPFAADADEGGVVEVQLQPFAAQVTRLVEALDYLGAPISAHDKKAIENAKAYKNHGAAVRRLQDILDRYCLLDVDINAESRVHVSPGRARPELVEQGWRTFLMKVHNAAGVTAPLRVSSPHARPVFSRGAGGFSMDPRPPQTITGRDVENRWLDLAAFDKPPMTAALSGLEVEYRIVQLYAREPGKREASLAVDVGQGSQDIGFRNDTPVLFTIRPSTDVTLRVLDERQQPTTASFVIEDGRGHVYPSPAKRLAPDFAFHPQIYRSDGDRLRLPAGEYDVEVTRGPEYLAARQRLVVGDEPMTASFALERWIDLAARGWYSGDHHIHAAGCMHYETPSQGVEPRDMIRHILGEALNIGAVLTWGPGYYYQKQFFSGRDHELSTPQHRMRYDVEVSGFPSSHSGHLVLLGLKDQDYPDTKVLEDWPTWDLPILKWARAQGAIAGFAHSGWGLEVKGSEIPTTEVPRFDGIGANEYIVDVTHDAVDFISTVDTPPVWELNIWYHTLNVGFRTRISGETDFPCIFGERVGLGRSYVQLPQLDYDAWAKGLRDGRAYVSDGRSHLIDFRVDNRAMGVDGSELRLDAARSVRVTAQAAARLDPEPNMAIRGLKGDEKPYWSLERARLGATRDVPVEVIVNGRVAARRHVTADGKTRDLAFDVPIEKSSWIALRILPSSHTNPIFVTVGGQPIRASRASADWCLKAVDQCWLQKSPKIAPHERDAAAAAYEHARQVYRKRLAETSQ